MGTRQGDAAETAMIELVDYNEVLLTASSAAPEKAKRTRRAGSAKKSDSEETSIPDAIVVEDEAPIADEVVTAPVVEDEAPVAEEVAEAAPVAEVEETPEIAASEDAPAEETDSADEEPKTEA